MADEEKYEQLLKEVQMLPSAETDELYQFSLQLYNQLKQLEDKTS